MSLFPKKTTLSLLLKLIVKLLLTDMCWIRIFLNLIVGSSFILAVLTISIEWFSLIIKLIACEANVTSWHLPIKLTDILKYGGSSSKLVLTVYQSNGWQKNKFHFWKFALLSWQRGWKNDVHMAIRDCNEARSINPMSTWAHHNMAEALSQVCISYLQSFQSLLSRCSYFPKFAI